MLDLYKLQIFATVVREGSFSAAAERLYMTQSAVSQHIQELEASLGRKLFLRGRRGVTLTPHGATLYEYTLRIFALVAEAENAVTDVSGLHSGQIKLGATPGAGMYLVPDWVQGFRAKYPQFTVSIQTGVTAQTVSDLLAHHIDLAFIEGEIADAKATRLEVLTLERVEQFVVVGKKHPWWEVESVPLEALNGQSFVVRQRSSQSRVWLDTVLAEHGITPIISAEFDNIEAIKRAVGAGMCISLLPEYVFHVEEQLGILHRLSIQGAPLCRELKLVYEKDAPLSSLARAFVDYVVGVSNAVG